MSTPRPSSGWEPTQPLAALLLALCLALLTFSTVAAASTHKNSAIATTSSLRAAASARTKAGHALASSSKRLKMCLRVHPGRCGAARRALRRARGRFTRAELRLASLNANFARHRASSTPDTRSRGSKSESSRIASGISGSHSLGRTAQGTTGLTGSSSGSTTSSSSGSSTGVTAGPFEMGLVAGSALTYELPFIEKLGAGTARMEFSISTPVSQIAPIAEAYARAGVRPLLLATFDGTIPSSAEAQNLGSWAAELGPGGSIWKGKTFPPGTAVTSIEFGNETSYSYQYSNDSASAYATRAQSYAIRFREAQAAIQAGDPNVGLLAQGDPGNAPGTSWMDNMFKAVPNLGELVAGWTVHPYGPNWQSVVDRVISSAQADGAPSSIPLEVTEWGLATDNGHCLDSNYGFNACMNYQEASTTLESTVAAMRARYGARLAAFYLYQAHDQQAAGISTSREAYFGALQSNDAPKGTYTTAVESLLSANP